MNSAHSRQRGTPSETPILQLTGIRKTYGAVIALHGVDFDARSGEVHAIVGENGAGKSTLISIAAGILEANAGEIRIMGRTVDDTDVRVDAGAGRVGGQPASPRSFPISPCAKTCSSSRLTSKTRNCRRCCSVSRRNR